MRLIALELVLSLLDTRGHIRPFDDFQPVPAPPTSAGLARAMAAAIAVFAAITLAIWATVSLAIHPF